MSVKLRLTQLMLKGWNKDTVAHSDLSVTDNKFHLNMQVNTHRNGLKWHMNRSERQQRNANPITKEIVHKHVTPETCYTRNMVVKI